MRERHGSAVVNVGFTTYTGTVTEPETHKFAASAARQFDALVHIDRTRALEPLERTLTWHPTAL